VSETGSVKFPYERDTVELPPFAGFAELNACRQQLLRLGLIGVDADGIGFGNLSVREGETSGFFITGSGTGALSQLALKDYARVTAYDFARNWLRCEGCAVASSESLTHAAIYEAETAVRAIIHCHSAALWKQLLGIAPTTAPQVEYGTPEMACEVGRLFEQTDVKRRKIFVTAGHEEGVVAFGATIAEALAVLMKQSETRLD